MDCVGCLLLGVCWLCGTNFGTTERGRPLTKTEIHQMLSDAFSRPLPVSSSSGGSRGVLDHRFLSMDIGKRSGLNLEPPAYAAYKSAYVKNSAINKRHSRGRLGFDSESLSSQLKMGGSRWRHHGNVSVLMKLLRLTSEDLRKHRPLTL